MTAVKKRRKKLPNWLDRLLLLLTATVLVAVGTVLGYYGLIPTDSSPAPKWARGHTHYRFVSENPILMWAGKLAVLALFAYAITFFISQRWPKHDRREDKWNQD
jgi:hypothetical protein